MNYWAVVRRVHKTNWARFSKAFDHWSIYENTESGQLNNNFHILFRNFFYGTDARTKETSKHLTTYCIKFGLWPVSDAEPLCAPEFHGHRYHIPCRLRCQLYVNIVQGFLGIGGLRYSNRRQRKDKVKPAYRRKFQAVYTCRRNIVVFVSIDFLSLDAERGSDAPMMKGGYALWTTTAYKLIWIMQRKVGCASVILLCTQHVWQLRWLAKVTPRKLLDVLWNQSRPRLTILHTCQA